MSQPIEFATINAAANQKVATARKTLPGLGLLYHPVIVRVTNGAFSVVGLVPGEMHGYLIDEKYHLGMDRIVVTYDENGVLCQVLA